MEERRRFIRVYTDIPMSYKHLGRDEEARTSALVNLSHMGLRLLCEEDLARGDMLELSFRLHPNAHTISTSAKVIWINHLRGDGNSIYEVGVKLVDIDYEDRLAIQQFVQDELRAERERKGKAYFLRLHKRYQV